MINRQDETTQGRKWVVFLLKTDGSSLVFRGSTFPTCAWSLGMMRACAERLVSLGLTGSHSLLQAIESRGCAS